MAMGLHSRRLGRCGRAPMAEINVTPLVDVMLVLLIIFMVTAPLLTAGVPVNLPQSKAGALKQDQEPVTVSIEQSGEIFIGDEAIADAASSSTGLSRRPMSQKSRTKPKKISSRRTV